MASRVEAVLSVRDQGFTTTLQKAQQAAENMGKGLETANQKSQGFMQTMTGMASAIGITSLISAGFNTITGSIDKALKRDDTMNNFRNTMKLLTGDVNLADKALADLGSATKGTAYGLDVAAKATQGLVTSGTEIGTATKQVGGWMDAVAVYGEGTNEQLSNVTFQLSQMGAKGKANLGDLKSAMEAGIPVIQIYAEATGKSTTQVSDAISKGEISSKQFMEVMDKAFRSGTKSFAAIEGAAKKAGGSWKGSMDNAKAAVTRGVLGIIQAFEEGRKEANLPGMKDAIGELGKFTENTLKAAAPAVKFLAANLETMVAVAGRGAAVWASYKIVGEVSEKFDVLKKSLETSSKSLEVMQGGTRKYISANQMLINGLKDTETRKKILAAAEKLDIDLGKKRGDMISNLNGLTKQQQAAILAETGALGAKSLITGVVTGKISLLTLAQQGLNAAWKANPIGFFIAGATALGGALTFLNSKLTEQTIEQKKANAEAQAMADASKDLVDSSKKLNDSYSENTTELKANSDQARRMVSDLNDISNSSKSAEEKQYLLKQGVAELNEKYPELRVSLNETGTALEQTTAEIDKQIQAMEEAAKAEAMKEYLSELYKEQLKQEQQLKTNTESLKKMEAQGLNTKKTLLGFGSETTEEYKNLQTQTTELTKAHDENAKAIQGMQDKLKIQSKVQFDAAQAAEEERMKLDALKKQYGVTTDAIQFFATTDEKAAKKFGENLEKIANKTGATKTQIIDYMHAVGTSLEGFQKDHDKYLDAAKEAVDRYVDNSINGWSRLKSDSKLSMDEYIKNMQENQKAVEKFSINISKLIRYGVNEDTVKEIQDKGAAEGGAIASQWVKDLEKINGGVAEGYETLNKTAKKKIDKLNRTRQKGYETGVKQAKEDLKKTDWEGMGTAPGQRAVDAVMAQAPTLNAKMTKAASTATSGVSGEYKKAAENAFEKFDGSISKLPGRAKDRARNVVFSSESGLAGLSGVMKDKANEGVNSFTKAVDNKQGSVKSRGKEIKSSFVNSVQSGFENRLFGIGTGGIDGFNSGARSKLGSAERTGSMMKGSMYDGLGGIFSKMVPRGEQAVEGAKQGVDNKKQSLWDRAWDLAGRFLRKFDARLEINSPSRAFRRSTGYAIEGAVEGVDQNAWKLEKSGTSMAGRFINAFGDPAIALKEKAVRSGEAFMVGIDEVSKQVTASQIAIGSEVGFKAGNFKGSRVVDSAMKRNPVALNLNIGGQNFRAFVENINNEIDNQVDLQLNYS